MADEADTGVHKDVPEKFRKTLLEAIRKVEEIERNADYTRAPWVALPDIPAKSIGWRMGGGETYLDGFGPWFRALSPEDRTAFMQENPEPEDWKGFYDRVLRL